MSTVQDLHKYLGSQYFLQLLHLPITIYTIFVCSTVRSRDKEEVMKMELRAMVGTNNSVLQEHKG